MDVAAINPTTTQTPTSTAQQSNDKNYETFLKMMTTQIKNQDPLNPMSADQLAVQLATFSAVEQQTKTNDLLTQMLGQNSLPGLGQMVSWVGKEARLAGPAYFDGTAPVTLTPSPATLATKAVLVAKDQGGHEVSRTEIPLGGAEYAWQGRNSQGGVLPKGTYTLSLESYRDDDLLATSNVSYYGRISEIRTSANGATVILPGGVEVLSTQITAIREAATP